MTIKCYPTDQLIDIDMISLAVCGDSRQRHIGILYHSPTHNTVKLLHLAWYNKLELNNPTPNFIWMTAKLPATVKITLTAWCDLIYEQNKNGIPYDIGLNVTGFDHKGRFIKKDKFSGLTCASFVMQVFKSHSIDLIDISNWSTRTPDRKWQYGMVKNLVKYVPFSRKIIFIKTKIQEIELGLQRFKPEEVASAATIPNFPHSQNILKLPSKRIVRTLNDLKKSCN